MRRNAAKKARKGIAHGVYKSRSSGYKNDGAQTLVSSSRFHCRAAPYFLPRRNRPPSSKSKRPCYATGEALHLGTSKGEPFYSSAIAIASGLIIIRLVRLVCILNLQNMRHGFKSVTAISFKFHSQCSPQADYLTR
jgi:hypothetical protein